MSDTAATEGFLYDPSSGAYTALSDAAGFLIPDGVNDLKTGTYTTLTVPLPNVYAVARGINSAGQIVGEYLRADYTAYLGFVGTPEVSVAVVEPGAAALLGAGLVGVGVMRRRRAVGEVADGVG